MNPMTRFAQYAAAFEKAYARDDWSLLEPYFTEDAVYEVMAPPPLGGRAQGRADVLAFFKRSVDRFDRRFDARAVELRAGPEEREGGIWLRWRGIYRRAGLPDLTVDGEETARFEGDRIRHLEDRIPDADQAGTYFEEHGEKLRPEGG